MAKSNVDIRVGSSFDAKGFKQAETAVTKLGRSVKNLGLAFGIAYSTKAVVNFGKSAVKAFTEDQKAAAQLSNTVKNLGLAFADADIQKFIEQLSLATGVVDDQLRPAMQKLLQTTGSVAKSQDLLKNAIDISRGAGVDLETVASDLSNAYVGNTKGLKKYALGLTQAELKAASFDKVLQAFNKNFSGASAAYLETYAGKLERLTTAAGEAKEKIGGALIDAAMLTTSSGDVDELISKINHLADSFVGAIDRFAEGFAILKAIKNSNIGNMAENIQKVQVEAYNQKLRRNYMDAWKGVDIPKTKEQLAAAKKAEDAAKKRAKAILDAQNKNTAELKKQAALKKAQSIFDMQNIQLVAALKNKLTEDEQNRVKALLALNNDNVDAAKYYSDLVVKAQDKTGELAKFIQNLPDAKNPFSYLDEWLKNFRSQLEQTLNPTINYTQTGFNPALAAIGVVPGYGDYSGSTSNQYSNEVLNGLYGMQTPLLPSDLAVSYNPQTGLSYNANDINLTITGDSALTKAIADSLQVQSLSGIPSSVQRLVSNFG